MPEGAVVQVSARCRPLTTNEKNSGATRIVKINGEKIVLHNPSSSGSTKEHNFSFNNCYSIESKNAEIYKDVGEPLLKKALEGYNVSIVAYGQTCSGKSHTIMGTMEEGGLISLVSQTLFALIDDASNIKDYFVMVSFLEIDDSSVHDLINPSGRNLKVRQHPQLGMYVDDIAEIVVSSSDDVIRLCDQGNRIQKLTTTDLNQANRFSSMFTITIEQKTRNTPNVKAMCSTITFVDLAGSDHTSKSEDAPFLCKSLNQLSQVVDVINQGSKGNIIPYRESSLTRLLQDGFGGNGYTSFIGHISPTDGDFAESLSTLKFATMVKSVQNVPKRNENDSSNVIKELREEIGRLRERLATGSSSMIDMPNSDDVVRMEELIKDLQLAKMQTWEEKQRISDMFLEERRHHLSNKGILDWVLDSMKHGRKDIQAKLSSLQKDKERLMIDYKEKRKTVDDLKDMLQGMITEYTKLTEAGKGNDEEGKHKVGEIHKMKEKLKQENEQLKKIKQNLKDVQEKQKHEKENAKTQTDSLKGNMELRFKIEAEQREKTEKENQATLADEIDRLKMEAEQEKAELKAKKSAHKTLSIDDLIKAEIELLDMKAEKAAMAIKLRSIENEKKLVEKDLNELFKRQKEELEIQQLQHFQTFRHYREAFEEQKAALELRYRALLEDSIQDAVYLSSRNQELVDENQNLKQELAELKDKLSTMGGRPTSPD